MITSRFAATEWYFEICIYIFFFYRFLYEHFICFSFVYPSRKKDYIYYFILYFYYITPVILLYFYYVVHNLIYYVLLLMSIWTSRVYCVYQSRESKFLIIYYNNNLYIFFCFTSIWYVIIIERGCNIVFTIHDYNLNQLSFKRFNL